MNLQDHIELELWRFNQRVEVSGQEIHHLIGEAAKKIMKAIEQEHE